MEPLTSARKSKFYKFKFNEKSISISLPCDTPLKESLSKIKKLVNFQYQSIMLIWNGTELDSNLPISHYQIGQSDEITIIGKDDVQKVENSKVKVSVSVSINSEKIDLIEDVNELFGTIIKKISETKKIGAEDYYLKFNNIILSNNQNLKSIVKPGCHQYNLVLSKKYRGVIIINFLNQQEMDKIPIENVPPSLTVLALKEKCNQKLKKVKPNLFSENCILQEELYVENYLTQNKEKSEFYLIGDDEIFIKIKKIANASSVWCVIMKKDNKVKMISKGLEKYFHLEGQNFGLFKDLELNPDLTWKENNILTLDEIIVKQKSVNIKCPINNIDAMFVIWKKENLSNEKYGINMNETIAKLKQIYRPIFEIVEERQMWYAQNKQLTNEQTLGSQLTNQNNNLIKIIVRDSEAPLTKKVTFFITLDNVDSVKSKALTIDLGEKVIDLKEKYKNKIGLPAEKQLWKLEKENKELLDTTMLFLQCEESKFICIHVVKKDLVSQILFEIYRKNGKSEVTLDVNLEHEISKLKQELSNIIGICAENQIWSYLGQMLNDHNNLLIVMGTMDPRILIRDSVLPDPTKLKILWFQPNLRSKAKPKQYEIEISKKVLELKGDLESEFNIEAGRQVWVYEDLELKDGITFEAQVKGDYEHPVKVTEIPIIKTIILEKKSGNIEFTANIHQTILALKSNVNSLLKIPIENQIWFWKKDELKDDEFLSSQVGEENGVYKLLLKVKVEIAVESDEYSLPLVIKMIDYPIRDLLDLVAQNCKRQPAEIELIYKNNKVNETSTLDELDDCEKFRFTLVVNAILRIRLGKEIKEIKVKKSTTIGALSNMISELFALADSNFKLYSGNTLLDDGKLVEEYKFKQYQEIQIVKMKDVTFNVISKGKNEILRSIIKENATINQVKEYFKIDTHPNCKIYLNSKLVDDNQSLDELSNGQPKLSFTAALIHILKLKLIDREVEIQFDFSETISEIKAKIQSKSNFPIAYQKYYYRDQIMNDNFKLSDYNIIYGEHDIKVIIQKQIIVKYTNKEIPITLEYMDPFSKIIDRVHEINQVSINMQMLFLINEVDGTKKRICNLSEQFKDFSQDITKFEVKLIKNFNVYFEELPKLSIKNFEGIVNEKIQIQKEFVQNKIMESNKDIYISVKNQKWYKIKNSNVGDNSELLDDKTLEDYEYEEEIKCIYVKLEFKFNVCFQDQVITLPNVFCTTKIGDLKKIISQKIPLNPKEQAWYYDEQELNDEATLLKNKIPLSKESIAVDLIPLNDFEYFGFSNKIPINNELFKGFFIETPEHVSEVIDATNFKKKESATPFRNNLLGLFFARVKKHSVWEGLIDEIKDLVLEKKDCQIRIWSAQDINRTTKFNPQFLLHYFLNSGDSQLKFLITKAIKINYPVPLLINQWENLFNINGQTSIDELYWTFISSFVITSFGFGTLLNQPCGKTQVINKLFFTNFQETSERHEICSGIPEIMFDIYKNNKMQVSLIDISSPSGSVHIENQLNLVKKLISHSNMIIVHALEQEKEDLDAFFKEMNCKLPIIILYRDAENIINAKKLEQQLDDIIKNPQKEKRIEINITNLKVDRFSQDQKVIKIVHQFIHEMFKISNQADLTKFSRFFSTYDTRFEKVLERIALNDNDLLRITPLFDSLKNLENDDNMNEIDKESQMKALESQLKTECLANELIELLKIILEVSETNLEKKFFYLEKFSSFLRIMRTQKLKDSYILYTYKSVLDKPNIPSSDLENFLNFWEKLKFTNPHYQRKDRDLVKNCTPQQALKFVFECIEIFENKVIPGIFSVELLWRELIYFSIHHPNYEIKPNENIENLLVKLKKEDILNGSPFEVIDGDMLYMAKNFLKQLFKGFNDRVIVISVIGPQSSGKSTLLNFLFGCDFMTSTGRCTRGIYGTYIKVSNFNICDGILVLDTEGLFSILSKKDEKNRGMFDRKLVLFCLAISDFLLVNTKGDLAKNMKDILNVCINSLIILQSGKMDIAQLLLILNQNNDTNINNHVQDINKLYDELISALINAENKESGENEPVNSSSEEEKTRERIKTGLGFDVDNVMVLPNAFDFETIDNKKIPTLQDPINKKKPRPEFYDSCNKLCNKLLQNIHKRKESRKDRTLEEIIDKMDHLWQILDKFPNLIRYDNLQDRKQELSMKEWIANQIEQIKISIGNEIKNIQPDHIKLHENLKDRFEKKFRELKQSKMLEFEESFLNKKKYNASIVENLKDYLAIHLNNVIVEFNEDLINIQHTKQVKSSELQAEENIQEAIKKVKSMNMNDIQKEQYFENVWNKVIENMEKPFKRETAAQNLFNAIKQIYEGNIVNYRGDLPITKFPFNMNTEIDEYKSELIERLKQEYVEKEAFEYSKNAPAMIFNGGMLSMQFKYFDIRKYYNDAIIDDYYYINRSDIVKAIDFEKIRREFLERTNIEQEKNKLISEDYDIVNKELNSMGLNLTFKIFEKYYRYINNFFLIRFIANNPLENHALYSEIKIDFGRKKNSMKKYVYIIPEKISEFEMKYTTDRTSLYFKKNVIEKCINWDQICKDINEKLSMYDTNNDINYYARELETDLQKINLSVTLSIELFRKYLLCGNDEILSKPDFMKVSSLSNIQSCDPDKLFQTRTQYLRYDKLKNTLITVLNKYQNNNVNICIGKQVRNMKCVKPEYQGIKWLENYINKDRNIYANTYNNKDLRKFVIQEFKFDQMMKDIFNSVLNELKNKDDYRSVNLIQKVYRAVNDIIGAANSDLQQVSFTFIFNFVSHVHLFVVYIIWKNFEKLNWNKIYEPINAMKNAKIKQKEYYLTMTSQDDLKKDEASSKSAKEKLQKYIENYFNQIKDKIINQIKTKFESEYNRKKIQDEIDALYFSRTQTKSIDEIYEYIIKPEVVFEKKYNKLYEEFTKDAEYNLQENITKFLQDLKVLNNKVIHLANKFQHFNEEVTNSRKMFKLKQVNSAANQKEISEIDDQLAKIHFKFFIKLVLGDQNIEFNKNQEIQVELNPDFANLQIEKLNNASCELILKDLLDCPIKIINTVHFLNFFKKDVDNLHKDIAQNLKLNTADLNRLKDVFSKYICKQKCPCCNRICGEGDPTHTYHQCLYGHQIRGIAGVKLNNNEASILRCEDIADDDRIQYDGRDMSWLDFTQEFEKKPINPWKFSDTKGIQDQKQKERFILAWEIIGEKICNDYYKALNIKFVNFNQISLDDQKKIITVRGKHYIFMIDSSGSMSGQKWRELLDSLKASLGQISKVNRKHRASIVNYSSNAQIEYNNADPCTINVDALTFQCGGTDFDDAFAKALDLVKQIKNIDTVLIFMSDGESSYPENGIRNLKTYISSSEFKGDQSAVTFKFSSIGFKCDSSGQAIIDRLSKDLQGVPFKANSEEDLRSNFFEIINKTS